MSTGISSRLSQRTSEASAVGADTGELIQRLDGHVANVSDYAFTPDGSELVTVTRLDGARLWSVADGQTRWRLSSEPEDHPTFTTAVHPDGNRVVFGSRSGAVLVHDVETGDRLETLDAHSSPVLTARFSRDGQRLVTTTSETARVWDVDQRRSVFVLRGHRQAPTDAAFSPDGERLMTTSEAETRIWDISVDGGFEHAALSYQAPLPATPHTSFVPGEPRLATSRPGGAVHTVDLDTLERQPVLPAHNRPVHAIAYSDDGSTIATSSIRGADGPSEEWRYQVDVWASKSAGSGSARPVAPK